MSLFYTLLTGADEELNRAFLARTLDVVALKVDAPALGSLSKECLECDSPTGRVGLTLLLLGLAHAEHLMARLWEELIPSPELRKKLVLYTQTLVMDTMLCSSHPPSLEMLLDKIMMKALAEGLH